LTTPFPEPPRVEELDGVSAKLRQNLQRWMSDLKRWGQSSGGGTGTVTSITGTAPIVVTPSPLTTVGVVSHAASGVTAATYGDATHYPVVTVDVNGHLTTVTSQAVAAAVTTKDEGVTLSTGVTTFDFVGAGVTASGAGATTTVTIPGSSGAPVDATYVVMSLNGTLTNERRLQVTGAASLTDGGANADATINVPGAGSAGSQFNWGKFIAGQAMWPQG
jgi:hypothetical protein